MLNASTITLQDFIVGARFLYKLPAFLRNPITPEEARSTLHRRFENRETDFLSVVKRGVYDNVASPYLKLLQYAGCEIGDLQKLVQQDGVEGALEELRDNGVYLSVDEFKGRCPIRRGSSTITAIDSQELSNPSSSFHVRASSSSGATPVYLDLESIRENAITEYLTFCACGNSQGGLAVWLVPGSAAMRVLLRYSLFANAPIRWFSQVDPNSQEIHPRYRWSSRVLAWGSLLGGVPLSYPMYTPVHEPSTIIQWMVDVLRAGSTPYLITFPSSALRLCQKALSDGIDLSGAHLMLSGEPITERRMAAVRATGAVALTSYASMEAGGRIGHGCFSPEQADDCHLHHDLHAMIQVGPRASEMNMPPLALLISTIRATAPFVLLNVSMGDQAVITERSCGCPLERLGWKIHLHTIRSYEKLTAGGMMFLDTDVIRVLEEVLPAHFGGAPTDYQLVEREDEAGNPCLKLLVHPAIPSVDTKAVVEKFIASVGTGSGAEKVMGLLWREGSLIEVERSPALSVPSGKILHLHTERR